MLLTIDVGNTHTVLGLFDGEEIVEHWRISTDARRTADELAVLLQGLMGMHPLLGEELGDGIDGIAICSTVPSVLHELREVTRRYYGDVPAVLVEPGVKTGVPILMDNPKEVGADRIINAVAAVELYGGPAIVVDFGTATTFDAVSARGEYVGRRRSRPASRSPSRRSASRGAQLRKIELARPRSVIGKNTVEAMQSGIVYGFAGQVDGIVEPHGARAGRGPRRRHGHRHRRSGPDGARRGLGDRRARALADPDRPAAGLRAQRLADVRAPRLARRLFADPPVPDRGATRPATPSRACGPPRPTHVRGRGTASPPALAGPPAGSRRRTRRSATSATPATADHAILSD